MSGHSKWSQIKYKKANTDAKKGKTFTKIVKEISISARIGGGDPDGNPRLRAAIDKAKEVNMPSENVKRAVMKGTGELPGQVYEEILYEGYGPGGSAVLINALTDNKNRTISDLRHIMSKNSGNIGESGSVAWMFDKRGYMLIDKKSIDEDSLMSVALDSGAIDILNDPNEENYEVLTTPEDFSKVKSSLESAGIKIALAEVTMLPKNYVPLNEKQFSQMTRLIEALEEHEDVENVYANFDVPEEMITP